MTLYAERAEHFADAFIRKSVGHDYDIVTVLWGSKVYSRRHFV